MECNERGMAEGNRTSMWVDKRTTEAYDGLTTDLHLDIGNGVSLEKVDKFCYLDMLDADGGLHYIITLHHIL